MNIVEKLDLAIKLKEIGTTTGFAVFLTRTEHCKSRHI